MSHTGCRALAVAGLLLASWGNAVAEVPDQNAPTNTGAIKAAVLMPSVKPKLDLSSTGALALRDAEHRPPQAADSHQPHAPTVSTNPRHIRRAVGGFIGGVVGLTAGTIAARVTNGSVSGSTVVGLSIGMGLGFWVGGR